MSSHPAAVSVRDISGNWEIGRDGAGWEHDFALIDGNPGAVWAFQGRARAAFVMTWREGRIAEIKIVADPRRLQALQIVL